MEALHHWRGAVDLKFVFLSRLSHVSYFVSFSEKANELLIGDFWFYDSSTHP